MPNSSASTPPRDPPVIRLTIHTLAVDGPKCGTLGSSFLTQTEAYEELLGILGLEGDDAANALIENGDFDELDNLLQESTDGLTTWTIEENTFPIPIPKCWLHLREQARHTHTKLTQAMMEHPSIAELGAAIDACNR